MFNVSQNKLKLLQRNEGKIKSYESCFDIRAWTHDPETRVKYLKDWIKCDMPICVVPVRTLASTLKMMAWKRRRTIKPKCHPDCESKVVLDSICNSCHAIKECFKNDYDFQKYFVEEEFETTHWPCERCLDALKSIKMFWKIILEKIFKVNFTESSESNKNCYDNDNIKSIAKAWQDEVIEQALFVKNLTPFINDQFSTKSSSSLLLKSRRKSNDISADKRNRKDTSTDMDFIIYSTSIKRQSSVTLCKKLSKCTSARIKTVDIGCGSSIIDKDDINLHKYNLDYLQQQYNLQSDEMRQLKRENIAFKLELRNMRKRDVLSYTPLLISDSNVIAPKPFESLCDEKEIDTVKDIESEMIITLKNCKNKSFRHVSMLQVLHKTNNSIHMDAVKRNYYKEKENPIEVLTKVHNTFGAIIKRELTLVDKNKPNTKDVNIEAYYRANDKTYEYPTCSAKSLHYTISDSIFLSASEVL